MKKFFVWILIVSLLALTACGGDGDTSTPEPTPDAPKDMTVHFIDVGQGDSTFIELPNGKTMLIDSGAAEYADKVISYISGLGYNTIDMVITTHPHANHIGAMTKIFEKFEIKKIYMPSATSQDQSYIDLVKAIENEGLKTLPAVAGNTLKDLGDDVSASFIARRTLVRDEHDNCAVLQLTYASRSFLFAADSGTRQEEIYGGDNSCDVLKVANHGKSTSTGEKLLNRFKPEIAVISCSKDEAPAQDVLDRLNKAGVKQVLRTDVAGNIVIKTNGDKLEVVKG